MRYQFANYRFEVYEGLVDAYLAMNRVRDASDISRDGVKRMGPNVSARSFVVSESILETNRVLS